MPFCMIGGTALGHGKGDEINRLPALSQIPLIIVNPGFQVSTAWAYMSLNNLGLTRTKKNANILIEKIQRQDISGMRQCFYNVFENVVIPKYPQVLKIKEELVKLGALNVLMTGSGPTVFALAQDSLQAKYIRDQLVKQFSFCIVSNTAYNSISKM